MHAFGKAFVAGLVQESAGQADDYVGEIGKYFVGLVGPLVETAGAAAVAAAAATATAARAAAEGDVPLHTAVDPEVGYRIAAGSGPTDRIRALATETPLHHCRSRPHLLGPPPVHTARGLPDSARPPHFGTSATIPEASLAQRESPEVEATR